MPDTSNYGWTYPDPGATTWATILNALFNAIDADLQTVEDKVDDNVAITTANANKYAAHIDGSDDKHAISHITALADSLDAKADSTHNHDANYAPLSHTHTGVYAAASHSHDDQYYTQSEIDTELDQKADLSHAHSGYSLSSHNHNSVYYTKTEVDASLSNKADTDAIKAMKFGYYYTEEFTASGTTHAITDDVLRTFLGIETTDLYIDPALNIEVWTYDSSGENYTFSVKTGSVLNSTVINSTRVLEDIRLAGLTDSTTYRVGISFALLDASA